MQNAHNAQRKHSVGRVRAACFSVSYFFVGRAHRRRESLLLQDPPSWVVRACGKCRALRDTNKQALVFNSFNVHFILPYITMPLCMFVSTDTHASARMCPYACMHTRRRTSATCFLAIFLPARSFPLLVQNIRGLFLDCEPGCRRHRHNNVEFSGASQTALFRN
jgi:hypothetical protein